MMISLLKGSLDVFNTLFDSGKANASGRSQGMDLFDDSKFGLNEQVKKLLMFRNCMRESI